MSIFTTLKTHYLWIVNHTCICVVRYEIKYFYCYFVFQQGQIQLLILEVPTGLMNTSLLEKAKKLYLMLELSPLTM